MNGISEAPIQTDLSRDEMYERVVANDAAFNGRFFLGVLTTGIYCLPSCRARRPLRTNVDFFENVDAARAAGLRPCRRCHPDDFARGYDPVIEEIEALADEVRMDPASFPNVRALVQRSGYGATRLFELFRLHFDTTPAAFLIEAKVDLAKRLLTNHEHDHRRRRLRLRLPHAVRLPRALQAPYRHDRVRLPRRLYF